MPVEFKLPDLGEGVAEGEVVRWCVQPGDAVAEDQPLVEVMTDKVTVEIPSPVAGRVLKILAREGDVIPVGTPMVVFGEEAAAAGAPSAAAPAPESVPAGAEAAASAIAAETGSPTLRVGTRAAGDGKVRAVPFVRRLARELNVDLATVAGTGPGGRITEEDVRAAASRAPAAPSPPPVAAPQAPGPVPPPPREERLPFRGIRRRTAERLVHSLQTTAPFTFVDEVDMTQLVEVREDARAWAEQRGLKLTYLPFVIKALIAALRDYPLLNATVDEERGEIVVKHDYNIGVATHTDEGLIVPVVRDADRKSLWQLAAEIEAQAVKARAGTLALEDIHDGTFTVTSLGVLGGMMATPIINPPEVAILGVHQIRPQPVVRDGQIVIRQMAHLSLTFDHRVIDGHVGAEFVQAVIGYLEHPGLLLLVEES